MGIWPILKELATRKGTQEKREREWGIRGWQASGRTEPNLIRNIIREIVSTVSVSWEKSGYPSSRSLPWEYSGIIGDFTHWHLLFYFLPTDERAREKPLLLRVLRVLIRVNIFSSPKTFLSSFKGFTSNHMDSVDTELSLSLSSNQREERDDGNRFQGENIPRGLVTWFVTCDAVSWQSRHTPDCQWTH